MKHRRRGQQLVEFGLIAVVFSLLLMGIVQYGLIVSTNNSVKQLTRRGVRYAAVHSDLTDLPNQMKAFAAGTGLSYSNVTYTCDQLTSTGTLVGSSGSSPSYVRMTVTYNLANRIFLPKFPGIGSISKTYTTSETAVAS